MALRRRMCGQALGSAGASSGQRPQLRQACDQHNDRPPQPPLLAFRPERPARPPPAQRRRWLQSQATARPRPGQLAARGITPARARLPGMQGGDGWPLWPQPDAATEALLSPGGGGGGSSSGSGEVLGGDDGEGDGPALRLRLVSDQHLRHPDCPLWQEIGSASPLPMLPDARQSARDSTCVDSQTAITNDAPDCKRHIPYAPNAALEPADQRDEASRLTVSAPSQWLSGGAVANSFVPEFARRFPTEHASDHARRAWREPTPGVLRLLRLIRLLVLLLLCTVLRLFFYVCSASVCSSASSFSSSCVLCSVASVSASPGVPACVVSMPPCQRRRRWHRRSCPDPTPSPADLTAWTILRKLTLITSECTADHAQAPHPVKPSYWLLAERPDATRGPGWPQPLPALPLCPPSHLPP